MEIGKNSLMFLVVFGLIFIALAQAQAPVPAPAASNDGTAIDQGIAYVLMLGAVVGGRRSWPSVVSWFLLMTGEGGCREQHRDHKYLLGVVGKFGRIEKSDEEKSQSKPILICLMGEVPSLQDEI
ncbi:Arabinogalactan protein 16-like protein [Drosera capensis]